jgi:predicted metalloprotease with PDZ domain
MNSAVRLYFSTSELEIRLKMFKSFTIVSLLFITCASGARAAVHQYLVSVDENIATATINICFDGVAPNYLAVDNRKGNSGLIQFPRSKQGHIEIQGRYWSTQSLPENACLNYKVDLSRHHAKRRPETANRKNIFFVDENSWLWLPETIDQSDEIEVTFQMPSWVSISTPWLKVSATKETYRIGHQPQDWGYNLMIGDFQRTFESISEGHVLSIASSRNNVQTKEINRWLVDIAKSVERYLGDYPSEQTQIILIAKPKYKNSPVPWGSFSRGNGFGILFVIVPSVDIKNFYTDWTASHEFSHQLLPKLNYDDIWLSEGLASYLQYVLMGQSKVIPVEKAWSKLYSGLKRGEKGTKKLAPEALSETAERRSRGGRAGRTMRIYWSGALYFMQADIALREQSKGKVGLNDILLKLNRCCIKGEKTWQGTELAAKLDELSNSDIFSPLFKQFSDGKEFPDYLKTMQKLGIELSETGDSSLRLKRDALARKIMQ